MVLNLFWKEFRENLWKAIILTVVAVGIVLLNRYFEAFANDCAACLILASLIATVWIAASIAAAERSAGSLDVLLALPARPLLIFSVKAIAGLLTILLPFSIALATISFLYPAAYVAPYRSSPDIYLCALAIPIPLFFLLLFFTMPARQESRAAMIGVLALLACLIWALLAVLISDGTPEWISLFPNPLLVLFDGQPPDAGRHLPVQFFTTLFWIFAAAWRFLRTTSRTGTGSEQREIPFTAHFLLPLPYPALLWKEIREQISIFSISVWAAVAVAVVGGLIETIEDIRHNTGDVFWDAIGVMLQAMVVAGAVVPLFMAIVIGVGSLANDLEDRLFHFWRGQPISVERWFWTKYLVGAVGIFVILVLPLAIAAGGSALLDFSGGNDSDRIRRHAWDVFIAVLIVLPAAHALSILFAAAIRRTMYATIFAMIALCVIAALPIPAGYDAGKIRVGNNLAAILTDSDQTSLNMFLLFLASLAAAAILLASSRQILKHNWRIG